MTGIVYSLIKPNTYWSKRTGQVKLSNFIQDDSQDKSIETEKNRNKLMEYQTHEARRNILSQKLQSKGILPFLRLSSLLTKMKYVINILNMDKF